ncbi:MAG: hypothetical protein ACREHG_01220 [Candidatus Saccharimonadales bacterium]
MKVLVLYRPDSEHASATESFLRDIEDRHEVADKLQVVNIDSREGVDVASLYDIVQYPGILILDDFGSVVHSWQGDSFPLIDEIVGYVIS